SSSPEHPPKPTTASRSRAPMAPSSRSLPPITRSVSIWLGSRTSSRRIWQRAPFVTYRAHGDDWFVISGTQQSDRIFYERHLLSHDGAMTEGLVMTYPAALKQKYDPIVARMAKSFRPGKGFQTPDAR